MVRYLIALALLSAACSTFSTKTNLGRVDGFGQVAKTLTWLERRDFGEVTMREIGELLGAERHFVKRRPVQIFSEWTEDLAWNDATGRYEIVFAQARSADAPFSVFRFSGIFDSKEDATEALASWLSLTGNLDAATRLQELSRSPDSFVKFEYAEDEGTIIRISMALHSIERQWRAAMDIETLGRQHAGHR